jgi:hypothetical protein
MSKKVTVQMSLPNVMTVGVEKYGLKAKICQKTKKQTFLIKSSNSVTSTASLVFVTSTPMWPPQCLVLALVLVLVLVLVLGLGRGLGRCLGLGLGIGRCLGLDLDLDLGLDLVGYV